MPRYRVRMVRKMTTTITGELLVVADNPDDAAEQVMAMSAEDKAYQVHSQGKGGYDYQEWQLQTMPEEVQW